MERPCARRRYSREVRLKHNPTLAQPDPAPSPLPDRRRILVIHNPVAGLRRRWRLQAVLAALRDLGCRVSLRATAYPGHATAIARAARGESIDAVLAAGGDGTINEVANGLAGSDLPLALCPLGTANVLAAEIGLEVGAAAIVQCALFGRPLPVALGSADGRRFVMMAGVGFDAEVVAAVSPASKRWLGKGAYVLASLRRMVSYGFPTFRLRIDGTTHEAASAVIARGHYYGGRFVCAPAARLDAPRFQVCLFRARGPAAVLRYGAALTFGTLTERRDVELLFANEVIVEGPAGDPVQADGDIIARLPVAFGISADRLNLLVPR